jgi:hypothetical protein
MRLTPHPFRMRCSDLLRILALLLLASATLAAPAQADPPARAGSLSHIEGSVVFAAEGETQWGEAVLNRPVTRGDRIWTDAGARAEMHVGSAVLYLDGETFLDVTVLDDRVLQASVKEGSVAARVRLLEAGENFEIDTPNLALRAAQPGAYRIDVDPSQGTTRVTVRSGMALVYGAAGQSQQVHAAQRVTFAGRNLQRVALPGPTAEDSFDSWAADRTSREDHSVAARFLPRAVVGYHQLDAHGTWVHEPAYGSVWYPNVAVADWAPYRYGRWEWVRPWGWTWIDSAPWGFAPFHYGRWAVIGSRWAWVPGRIGPRPVFAPALVVFAGGSGPGWGLSVGSSPGVAWYPLAPGELWRPVFRATPTYIRNANAGVAGHRGLPQGGHVHQRRPDAVTAVTVEDFSRGRPVHRHRSRIQPAEIGRAPTAVTPVMPQPRRLAPERQELREQRRSAGPQDRRGRGVGQARGG